MPGQDPLYLMRFLILTLPGDAAEIHWEKGNLYCIILFRYHDRGTRKTILSHSWSEYKVGLSRFSIGAVQNFFELLSDFEIRYFFGGYFDKLPGPRIPTGSGTPIADTETAETSQFHTLIFIERINNTFQKGINGRLGNFLA